MPVISRIWARSALISAGLQPQQETGTRATGQRNWPTYPAVPPGTDDQNSTPAGNLSRRSRSYGHSMGVNAPARKSALVPMDAVYGSPDGAWQTRSATRHSTGSNRRPERVPAVSSSTRASDSSQYGQASIGS